MPEESRQRTPRQYVDLEGELPEYECSKCGWLHDEEDAWGINKPNDRVTCPKCNVLAHSQEVRTVDHDPNSFTGFKNRKVRL
jgi:NAD-dependent SIR2 family protein deacetylase